MKKIIIKNALKEIFSLICICLILSFYQLPLLEQTIKKVFVNFNITTTFTFPLKAQGEIERYKIYLRSTILNSPSLMSKAKEDALPIAEFQTIIKTPTFPATSTNLSTDHQLAQKSILSPEQSNSITVPSKCHSSCTILLLGDSLMGDVYFALSRQAKKEKRQWNIISSHKVSSGLTNSSYYDWPSVAKTLNEQYKPDVAIVLLGANDAQSINIKPKPLVFASAQWSEEYAKRVHSLISSLSSPSQITKVYWIELPVMKEEFEKKISLIRLVHTQSVKEKLITTSDILPSNLSEEFKLTRQSDGIHLSAQGAALIAKKISTYLLANNVQVNP